ncbi:MAG TPA: DNA internalization-related competence protein ComEC/Rec2 [Candidatus Acidoferrum sp.]|nr:DNA internalization-related competence protein ComEC/Rec2 [Candidatus Acidoferrum sp.]
MRLPALAIAAAFACGIALGLHPIVAAHASSVLLLSACFLCGLVFIVSGFALTRAGLLFSAGAVSLLSWSLLGFLGACVAEQPLPPNHVKSLLAQSRLALQTPLRWHGYLRDEPAKLPWGYGIEVNLAGVEFEGSFVPAHGGLRVSYTPKGEEAPLPELHAGDEVAVLTEARLPQVFRDEGAFDRRAYLAQQGIDLVATLRSPSLIERAGTSRETVSTRLARARRLLREEIDRLCEGSPQAAGVLRAMLLGDRSFVDRAESTDFQKTGAFHVLVVAGLHVGAIAAVLFWAGRKLRMRRSLTVLFTLALLFAYVAIVEQRPPVLRAAVMAGIVVLGGFFFRRLELLNSAAVAALALLIAKPLALRDSSFQLTFVAIGCIAGLAVPWLEKTVQPYVRALHDWRDVTRDAAHEPRAAQFRIDLRSVARWMSARLPQWAGRPTGDAVSAGLSLSFRAWELLVVTIALQIGMLPLMARDFHRVTLSAPLVNLAAVPMVGVLVPLGFVTLAAGRILPAVGKLLAAPLVWLTALLMHVVEWFAHFPRWSYRIPGPPVWLVMLFFSAGVAIAAALRHQSNVGRIPVSEARLNWACGVTSLIWIGFALLIAVFPFSPKWAAGRLEVSVLDVGQGDSLFIVSPGGKTLLIDGGGAFGGYTGREGTFGADPGEEAVSPYLWSRGFQKLDVVALTHAHQDHLGGLTAVLENFRVGELWIGREVSSAGLSRLEELAKSQKILIEHELRGKTFGWDGVQGEFLWPDTVSVRSAQAPKNDDSLVLRLRYGDRSILLPGDAEKQSETAILAENTEDGLRSDVLKVGHHGGKNSTTQEFLDAVEPRLGIISVGEANPYGHPSPELLQRLQAAGVRIVRTDRDGAVHILTDGKRIDIRCFVTCVSAESAASTLAEIPNQKQRGEKK